jgi:glycosyltransferase involved in cell wall biosynthesis
VIALTAANESDELHAFVRDAADVDWIREEASPRLRSRLDDVVFHVAELPYVPVLQRLWLEQNWIPRTCSAVGIDSYIGCDFTLPKSLKIHRRLAILPDLIPFTRPATVSLPARMLYRDAVRFAANSGAGLLCISETTRRKLLELFPQCASRSLVLHPPLSPMLWTYASREESIDLRMQVQGSLQTYVSQRPFLLAVGSGGTRKNTALLVKIHRELVLSGDYHGSLVLTGGNGLYHNANSDLKLAVVTIGQPASDEQDLPAVYDIGRVNEFDLSRLYRSADLLVNLSAEEGFGYPVLEALAHGTPALVTRGSAMTEIASGGIAETGLDPSECRVKLLSTLNALPLLRREAAQLDLDQYSVENYGRQILDILREMESD